MFAALLTDRTAQRNGISHLALVGTRFPLCFGNPSTV